MWRMFGVMAGADHDASDAPRLKETQLVSDKRITVHVEKRLGETPGERPQPSCETTREQRQRQGISCVCHTTTLVPSKSNRNRTSRRPSWNMSRRRRVLSSV